MCVCMSVLCVRVCVPLFLLFFSWTLACSMLVCSMDPRGLIQINTYIHTYIHTYKSSLFRRSNQGEIGINSFSQ